MDEALEQLSPPEHDPIVLRFLDGQGFTEVGIVLGKTEDAARMQVNRALETLRGFFQERGVTISAAALALLLTANAAQAAPTVLLGITNRLHRTTISGPPWIRPLPPSFCLIRTVFLVVDNDN